MRETCETCRWWRREYIGHDYANCHRMPPDFTMFVTGKRSSYGDGVEVTLQRSSQAAWPNTHKEDFCGEHAKKEPGDADD